MPNAHGRSTDHTHLSVDQVEDRLVIHRDYIAHALRWSHVAKWLMGKREGVSLLDIGCGVDLPLARMIYTNRLGSQVDYYGVDVNPLDKMRTDFFANSRSFEPTLFAETDILDVDLGPDFDVVTCFEMLEHVEARDAVLTIGKIKDALRPTGTAFVSTPCWNFKDTADNHVNEMTFHALGVLLTQAGFTIEAVYGTFASQIDYLKLLSSEEREIFDRLRDYYDSNLLSIMLAPLYPEGSRNALWRLRHTEWMPHETGSPWSAAFASSSLEECDTPWSSANAWWELDASKWGVTQTSDLGVPDLDYQPHESEQA